MPITINIDNIMGIIVFLIGIINSILSYIFNFKARFGKEIDAICVQLKSMLEERISQYTEIKTQNIDEVAKVHKLETILREINKLGNEYHDWNRIITQTTTELRKAFLWGIVVVILSIFFFLTPSGDSTTILLMGMTKIVVGIIIVIALTNYVPILFQAYLTIPNRVDKRYQEIKDGDFASWLKDK